MTEKTQRAFALLFLVLGSGMLAPRAIEAANNPDPVSLLPSLSRATIELDIPQVDEDVLRQIEIETGKSIFVRAAYGVKRVSVGNPEVLDVVVLNPKEFQLVAKSVGTTNLLVWDLKGRPQAAIDIHVGAPHSRLQAELRRILNSDDIQVESAGNGIVLKGSVPTAVAMEQSLSLARAVLSEDGREAKTIVNLMEVRGHHQVMLKVAHGAARVWREFERADRIRWQERFSGQLSRWAHTSRGTGSD
jgi:pilus assembly protein CpaC